MAQNQLLKFNIMTKKEILKQLKEILSQEKAHKKAKKEAKEIGGDESSTEG